MSTAIDLNQYIGVFEQIFNLSGSSAIEHTEDKNEELSMREEVQSKLKKAINNPKFALEFFTSILNLLDNYVAKIKPELDSNMAKSILADIDVEAIDWDTFALINDAQGLVQTNDLNELLAFNKCVSIINGMSDLIDLLETTASGKQPIDEESEEYVNIMKDLIQQPVKKGEKRTRIDNLDEFFLENLD